MKHILLLALTILPWLCPAQLRDKPQTAPNDTLTLFFIGDIMQHEPQIRGAWDNARSTYDYMPCFRHIAPDRKSVV